VTTEGSAAASSVKPKLRTRSNNRTSARFTEDDTSTSFHRDGIAGRQLDSLRQWMVCRKTLSADGSEIALRLRWLQAAHTKKGIINRDIKPRNNFTNHWRPAVKILRLGPDRNCRTQKIREPSVVKVRIPHPMRWAISTRQSQLPGQPPTLTVAGIRSEQQATCLTRPDQRESL